MVAKKLTKSKCSAWSMHFWGWFLVIVGVYYLGINLKWFSNDTVKIWPLILVALGIYFLVVHHKSRKK